ncbi:MAG: hypothetical protein WCA90_15935, partial [Ilumatobacteraceae bacterium]
MGCPDCGVDVAEHQKFCHECGRLLTPPGPLPPPTAIDADLPTPPIDTPPTTIDADLPTQPIDTPPTTIDADLPTQPIDTPP